MNYKGVFEADKIKVNFMPTRDQVAYFVYTYTNYKLFTHNGIVWAIDDANIGELKQGDIKITNTGLSL